MALYGQLLRLSFTCRLMTSYKNSPLTSVRLQSRSIQWCYQILSITICARCWHKHFYFAPDICPIKSHGSCLAVACHWVPLQNKFNANYLCAYSEFTSINGEKIESRRKNLQIWLAAWTSCQQPQNTALKNSEIKCTVWDLPWTLGSAVSLQCVLEL